MPSVRSFLVVGATCLLHLISPGTAFGQTTSLDLKSQPGDYIGGGIDQTFTPTDGIFTAFRTSTTASPTSMAARTGGF